MSCKLEGIITKEEALANIYCLVRKTNIDQLKSLVFINYLTPEGLFMRQ